MGMQMFDIRTGTLSALSEIDKSGMDTIIKQLQAGLVIAPPTVGLRPPESPLVPIIYIQPIPVQQVVPPPISPH
jgi:hypothetical protein